MTTVAYALQDMFIGDAIYTWTPLTTTNADGQPAQYQGAGDRVIQAVGTWGAGGTLIVEGSVDGVNYAPLHNAQGTTISLTANGLTAILENCPFTRARVTAGDGTTSLTVQLAVRRVQNG